MTQPAPLTAYERIRPLNQVLEGRGYTTRPAGLYRKDIVQGDEVVLESATAFEVWNWLGGIAQRG